MSYETWIDGKLVSVVTPSDLGCKSMEDLRKLCSTAKPSKMPSWPNSAVKDAPESPQNAS